VAVGADRGADDASSSPSPVQPRAVDPDSILAFAAAVEKGIRHPLAEAVCAEAKLRGLDLPETVEAYSIPGVGVQGLLRNGNLLRSVSVGSELILAECPERDQFIEEARTVEPTGYRTLYVTVQSRPVAVILVREQPVAEAGAVVEDLSAEDVHVEIISGDGSQATATLARRPGTTFRGNASPEDKLAHIDSLRSRFGPVALVGDGVNDSAALVAADVGIAPAHGAPLSIEAAPVTLYNSDLRSVPWLIHLARRTRRTIRQNLVWTFVYNAFGLGLAVSGLLHPLVAVVIMVLSSVLVSWNAHRLKRELPGLTPTAG